MRDLKHLQSNAAKLAQDLKEKVKDIEINNNVSFKNLRFENISFKYNNKNTNIITIASF